MINNGMKCLQDYKHIVMNLEIVWFLSDILVIQNCKISSFVESRMRHSSGGCNNFSSHTLLSIPFHLAVHLYSGTWVHTQRIQYRKLMNDASKKEENEGEAVESRLSPSSSDEEAAVYRLTDERRQRLEEIGTFLDDHHHEHAYQCQASDYC